MQKPPAHLGTHGRRLWRDIQGAYGIADPGGLALLRVAAEALDRTQAARERIGLDGATLSEKGKIRAHPLLAVERDARAQLIQALKALNLDLEPLAAARDDPPAAARTRSPCPGSLPDADKAAAHLPAAGRRRAAPDRVGGPLRPRPCRDGGRRGSAGRRVL
jgi:P27 family predicted phage terminase small subunit